MSQPTRILSRIAGFRGWKIVEARWESSSGRPIEAKGGYAVPTDAVLVLAMGRRWAHRCPSCLVQRQTLRLQQTLALDTYSIPFVHVATNYSLNWYTFRRA